MPALEIVGLIHDALLYSRTGDSGDGEVTLAASTPIKCRWTDDHSETTDPLRKVQQFDGRIATAIDLAIGDIVVRVKSDKKTAISAPMQVQKTYTRDDVKGKFTRREYGLVRYKGTVPA